MQICQSNLCPSAQGLEEAQAVSYTIVLTVEWDATRWQVNELEGRLLASQKQLEDLQRVSKAFNDHQVQLVPDQSSILDRAEDSQLHAVAAAALEIVAGD